MSKIDLSLRLMHRFSHKLLWNRYASLSAKKLQNAYLIVSFDCDTDEDIDVVWDVHTKLLDIGIRPVYAVPGALLQRGEKVYSRIRDTGVEFINHGGREHTYYDTQKSRHASCFFYDQQLNHDITADIELGHKTLNEVLGVTPKGWRTPHFGTYQNQEQLAYLYAELERLNYSFSTSTTPLHAFKYGPSYYNGTMLEIPVTGIFSEPFNIMDTWGFFAAPDRTKTANDYLQTATALQNFTRNKALLLNIYGDPSHIHDKPEFFSAMQMLATVAKNINYEEYLGIINDNLCNIK